VKKRFSQRVQRLHFATKEMELWNRARRNWDTFSLPMRRSSYLGASCQKSDHVIRSGDL